MRWYTVPCDKQFCFQHLRAIKGMGSGPAARVWREQTNHKLVRHPASDTARYRNCVAIVATAKGGLGCCTGDVKEEVEEME